MTGYKGAFEIKWWGWYIVDLRDWHKPTIVRKHFQRDHIAQDYIHRYLTPDYQIIRGYEAQDMDLKDGLNHKKKHRHKTLRASKYHFPEWCKTQKDKEFFRAQERRRLSKIKRMPEFTLKDMYHLLNRNPIRFCVRTKIWKDWEYAYSLPTPNIDRYIKKHKWPRIVNLCVIIEKTLKHYNYDIGIWPMYQVVLDIYDEYGHLVDKFHNGWAKSHYWAAKEFEARGFTKALVSPSGTKAVVKSHNGIRGPQWYWPEHGRLGSEPSDLLPIYELQKKIGIAGFTQAYLPKKYRG